MKEKFNRVLDSEFAKPEKERGKEVLDYPLFAGMAILLAGNYLEGMQWAFSKVLIIIGYASIFVLFLVRFLLRDKTILRTLKLVLLGTWCAGSILLIWLEELKIVPAWLSSASLWTFLLVIMFYRLFIVKKYNSIIERVLGMLAFTTVIMGVLFKIMFWPFANILIVSGLALVFAWYMVDTVFKMKKKDE